MAEGEKKHNTESQSASGQNVIGSINASGTSHVDIRQTVYTQLSEVDEERERQEAELGELARAVTRKYTDLERLITKSAPATRNPYLFLQPFGFTDANRFFGRDELIEVITERVSTNPTTFLDGGDGLGKTSLIRAGLVPALLADGHLPLVISLGNENIESAIKKELLPNVGEMPFLEKMSLAEFISRVFDYLPEGKWLGLFIDDFEDFFNQEENTQKVFRAEWNRCINGAAPEAKWLFCVPSGLTNLRKFFKEYIQPDPNTISVPLLDRQGANDAILNPAEISGIVIDQEVVHEIIESLGGENVNPAQLQLVCYILAGGRNRPVKAWTKEYYQSLGKVEGILLDYLDRAIETIETEYQEPAWQLLAVLSDPHQDSATELQLVTAMKEQYEVPEPISRQVLSELQENHLIERARAYRLASDSLRPRIQKWLDTRSTREKMRQEATEQLRAIRNSALRGFFGGAFGFVILDQLLFVQDLGLSFDIFFITLTASIGAIAGILLVFSADVAAASSTGTKKWVSYLSGGTGGAIAFAIAMVMYMNLSNNGDVPFLRLLPFSLLEGGLWGFASGIGVCWVLISRRPAWITAPAAVLFSGFVLFITDLAFGILRGANGLDTTPLTIALAGIVFPACILLASMAGRKFGKQKVIL